MPGWLCKIWKFFANLLGKIVDFIVDVLSAIVDLAVAAVGSIADALLSGGLGSWLLLGAAAFIGYKIFFAKKDEDDEEEEQPVERRPREEVIRQRPSSPQGTVTARDFGMPRG
ncbi:P6 [Pseudomonas phage phi2954]|uniref:p6 n=1 Tax=Pseudomonas phage phi2954 TaxID=593131 RepID=C0KIU2_9VIRU|nr:P6 [Pseudomonas phage phi2954]ACM91127.1 P6 [Pseudomonas phage phi2954]